MQTVVVQILLKLLVEASKNEDIRNFIADQVDRLKDSLLPDIVSTFPAFSATMLKEVFEKLPGVPDITESVQDMVTGTFTRIINEDPDIPGISDKIDLTEIAKSVLGKFGL